MKLPRSTVIVINIAVILVGIIFLILGVRRGQSNPFLEGVGISLIATGGVNLLDRLLTEKPKVEGVRIVANVRATLDQSIHNRKNQAEKIDIVGISLTGCLKHIINDSDQTLIDRVLFNGVRLRLAFVHPNASFIAQRAIEDNMDHESLYKHQLQSIKYSIMFFKLLENSYNYAIKSRGLVKPQGSVQIKLIEFCPYITIERYDADIYWGLYTSDTAGVQAPMFLTSLDENYLLYNKLKNHFTKLMDKDLRSDSLSSKNNFLVNMEVGAPRLNNELAKDLLGEYEFRRLLG